MSAATRRLHPYVLYRKSFQIGSARRPGIAIPQRRDDDDDDDVD
jgi:hypothetical protein